MINNNNNNNNNIIDKATDRLVKKWKYEDPPKDIYSTPEEQLYNLLLIYQIYTNREIRNSEQF